MSKKPAMQTGGGGASAPAESEPMEAPGAPAPEWTTDLNPHLKRAGTHRSRRRTGAIGDSLPHEKKE